MHAKAERLEKELKKEREKRDALEKKDDNLIRTLHLQMKSLSVDKEQLKKNLQAARNEFKGNHNNKQ